MAEHALEVRNLVAGYGPARILHGVDLHLDHGEVLAVLGRNGMGKTTLVHTITGLIRPTAGSVRLFGHDTTGARPHVVNRAGVALVPQGRRVFSELTVQENLAVAARSALDGWTIPGVYDLLPQLAGRRRHPAGLLSGGEQQMLAIGRALVANPRLLVLDEPSDGLAPAIVRQVGDVLSELCSTGLPVLLVEQDLTVAFRVADRVAVVEKGRIVVDETATEFRSAPERGRRLLGVSDNAA